jgi:hypothetical protein
MKVGDFWAVLVVTSETLYVHRLARKLFGLGFLPCIVYFEKSFAALNSSLITS